MMKNQVKNDINNDIKILEELLDSGITFNISPTDYGHTAIRNLINKFKRTERMKR